MGLDQWANFYASYVVLASKIEVTSQVNGGSAATQRHGIVPTLFSTTLAGGDQERAEELPYSRMARNFRPGGGNTTNTGNSFNQHYMTTAKINGEVPAAVEIGGGYGALVSANPSAQWYWHVFNYVPGAETQSLFQTVVLTYYVVFYQRNQLSVS